MKLLGSLSNDDDDDGDGDGNGDGDGDGKVKTAKGLSQTTSFSVHHAF